MDIFRGKLMLIKFGTQWDKGIISRGGKALKWCFTVHVLVIACRQALNSLVLPRSEEGKGERELALMSQDLHIRVPE